MLVQHPEVKHWLIVGMNDSTVLGGVRATEGQGFKAADIIGIGINGVDAVSELSKAQATGFYGFPGCQARTYMVISPAKCFTTG
ncbi:L-arabinose-binding periplasmic protein [Escherichia coli]|uniref:L-arabinose-binding periplasmic protein n=1 Tax=Escherichia coli TaxID=562 RepID=A0A2X1ND48_ECOLX|nr:L-arabinose-binding periplasmic protein [Escherichia coli]